MPALKPLTKFALTIVGGAMVGGPVAGTLYFLFPSDSISGSGKASKPRLVIAKAGETNSELSFNYDSFFTKKSDESITFAESKMSFNGYQLKEGDILCSPKQNGKFYILEEVTGRGKPTSTYRIKGYKHFGTITKCTRHDIQSKVGNDESKTIELKGLNHYQARNSYSAGIDTIYVSSCVFEATKQETNTNKWGINWDKCKLKEFDRRLVPKFQIDARYEIK